MTTLVPALLRVRDVRMLWAGETVTALGTAVSSVAVPLVALEVLDARVLAVTLLTAATWLPWLLIGLPAGAWVDRLPKRPVLVSWDVTSALLLLSVPLAAAAGVLTVAQLLVVNAGVGTASVFFRTAWTAYVPAVVSQDGLVPANALLHGGESAAQVADPGLGGLLVAAVGAVGTVVVDALSYVLSAVCLLRVRAVEAVRPAPRRLRAEVEEGVRLVLGDRLLRNLVVHGAVANLPLIGSQSLVVVFLVREAGQGPTAVGLLLAAGSVGGVLGASVSGRVARRLGTARALMVLKGGAGPCALLMGLADDGWRVALFALGTALVGAGVVAGNVISTSFRQTYVPSELLGRVMSAMQFCNLGTIPLGAVLAGVLAGGLGTRPALVLLTAGYAASGLILVLGPLRGMRDLPDGARALAAPALPG